MSEPTDDLSKELAEARREMRKRLLALGDAELKDLYYRTIALSEHEAARGASLAPYVA